MAKNIIACPGLCQSIICTNPTTPASGGPVRYGTLTGIALTNEGEDGNAAGYTTVDFGFMLVALSVAAINEAGNSAVAVGDPLFYVDADTPHISKKATGYFFGFAMEAIESGATATINVLHVPSPGAGTLGTGTIVASNLAADAVETAKILDLNVTTGKLANLAVTAAKLAADAVETAKIKALNVTPAKLSAVANNNALAVPLGTAGAVSATLGLAVVLPVACTINSIQIVTKDEVTANDTNYWTLIATNKGADGTGIGAVGAKTTKVAGGASMLAYTPWTIGTIDPTAGVFVAGGVLHLALAKSASATALAEASLMIDYLPS